jgi:DNA-3-methyladenine glycosylase
MPTALPPDFYARDTTRVARELLGKRLCHQLPGGEIRSGIIVETEAYLGIIDKAAHTYGGKRTARTETMFGAPGLAYVYLIYGMYHCLNAVTRAEGVPEAVLIRALEPEHGHEQWEQELPRLKPRQWLSGPGRLCRGMKIDKVQNGLSFCDSPLWIEEARRVRKKDISAGPRVGIDYAEEAVEWPLRFSIAGNCFVSRS